MTPNSLLHSLFHECYPLIALPDQVHIMAAERQPFPRDEALFKDDYRVSFDKSKDAWILEDVDKKEYEWNSKYGSWVETVRMLLDT